MFKRLNFVVHLHENSLGRHFPIHAIRLIRVFRNVIAWYPKNAEQSLPFRPNCTSSVKSLKFDSHEIPHLAVFGGYEDVVNAPPGDGNLRNDMQLVTRLMQREQVEAIRENLPSLNEPSRTNNNRLWRSTVKNGTSPD